MDNGKHIAETILAQLGGNRFLAMTGAKNLLHDAASLSFKLPGIAKANYVKITLDPDDTYSVEFGKLRGLTYKTITTLSGVYCDNLQSVFTAQTGLDTHL